MMPMADPSGGSPLLAKRSRKNTSNMSASRDMQEKISMFQQSLAQKGSKQKARNFGFTKTSFMPLGGDRSLHKALFETKTYIAPGNLGTKHTVTHWNKHSSESLGTTKTLALRFDQYTPRPNPESTSKVNAHEMRFENINKLPSIHSSNKKSLAVDIRKQISRQQACPPSAGFIVNSIEALTQHGEFYSQEIPKFYKGQPGYKQSLRESMRQDQKKGQSQTID